MDGQAPHTFSNTMSKKTKHGEAIPAPAPTASAPAGHRHLPTWMVYAVGFIAIFAFCTLTYGEVFAQIARQNYVTTDSEAMFYVRRLPLAWVYWPCRFLLLVFLNKWLGGLFMALLLTLSAWLIDCLPVRLCKRGATMVRGLGFIPVVAIFSWMVYRGYDLYFRCEISTFMVWSVALFAIAALVAAASLLVPRRKTSESAANAATGRLAAIPVCALIATAAYGALTWQAMVPGENVRITCAMQNRMAEGDWEEMAQLARSAEQPTRSIAAYYAIALVQQGQLLEHVFDIPYNFPDLDLDNVGGNDEGINYIATANLFAGLPNSAYRTSMENLVMHGPRVNVYKRMAIAAILNDETQLAQRYLHLISLMPFQQDFVEHFMPYVGHLDQMFKDPVFANIHSLYPQETEIWEQNCRNPVFLGYNAVLRRGSDATLITSIATIMYSKSIDNFLIRANVMQQKQSLPLCVQQAVLIASMRRPGLLDQFPQVRDNEMLKSQFKSFSQDVAPLVAPQGSDKETKKKAYERMAKELKDEWLGSYYYYYYCGNLNQTVTKNESHGVN